MDKTFGVIGEGQPDYIIISHIIYGFFNDKTISVRQLFPEQGKSGGFGRVINFISTEEFRTDIKNIDYCIIQIDTNECDKWGEKAISPIDGNADLAAITVFIEKIKVFLIKQIGVHYQSLKDKIIFAITAHDLECWLLPFNSSNVKIQSKILTCKKTMEEIARDASRPIYKTIDSPQRIKNFQHLSKDMRKQKELFEKSQLNPSLNIFVEGLKSKFIAL